MNKYLLLRDNKQTGPYTVPEIIEIGIKPYDLVWLEGKSAAWRYPSEIEELKAFAPSVEEQPFDRFYKTREAILNQEKQKVKETIAAPVVHPVAAEHSPYEPKVTEEITQQESLPRKKVYINFPVSSQPEIKAAKPAIVKEAAPAKEQVPFKERTINSTFSEQNVEHISSYAKTAERLPNVKSGKPAERKMIVYATAAACIILLGFITLLLINNSGQKKRLQELNTIVKEIQDRNNNVSQVNNVEPAPAPEQTAETIINPELLKLNEAESLPQTPNNRAVENSAAITVTPSKPQPSTPAVVTSEGNGRPVLRRADKSTSATAETSESTSPAADAPASENLFKQVNVQPGKYKVGMLGGISNLTLNITNNSNRELHKVVVQIKYLGPEKKVVNTQTVYFENVAPGAQSTIEVPKSKRGVSIDYTITDIKS